MAVQKVSERKVAARIDDQKEFPQSILSFLSTVMENEN
jgi:hypothetical protein